MRSSQTETQKTRRTVDVDLWLSFRKQILKANEIRCEEERRRVIHALRTEHQDSWDLIGVILNPDGTLNERGKSFVGVSKG